MARTDDNWDIVGHEWAVGLLAGRLAAGRMSHAYLFTGPPEIGKSLLAIRLAQAMNCTGERPPCGECRACDLMGRETHPDLIVVEPDGASIKIEQVRDLLNTLNLHPFEARYRIGLIRAAQRMTPSAADALLKTLEEPPATVRLILTADEAEAIPATISSRCQIVALRLASAREIEAGLMLRLGLPPEQAKALAGLCGGRPGAAIKMAHQPEIQERRAEILDEMTQVLRSNRKGRFDYSEALAGQPDEVVRCLELWQSWWRDAVWMASGLTADALDERMVNSDRQEAIRESAAVAGYQGSLHVLEAIHDTIATLTGTNASARLALDVLLLKLPFV